MKNFGQNIGRMAIGVGTLLAVGCSATSEKINEVLPNRDLDYKKAQVEDSLEIPPDLSSANVRESLPVPGLNEASLRQFEAGGNNQRGSQVRQEERSAGGTLRKAVLTEVDNIEVRTDGSKRWLVVQADPGAVWEQVRDFWLDQGFLLRFEEPRIGVLETDWNENRADIKGDFIRDTLKGVLDFAYSAGTRDKYRVRLERGPQAGTTELFLTHYGMEEVLERAETTDDVDRTVWKPRPNDPELEAAMLSRMMVYLGLEEDAARQALIVKRERQPRARLTKTRNGGNQLNVTEGFDRTWRLVGLALDQVGFTVEDRDRTEGVYYVRYNDPFREDGQEKGFFSKLAFWQDDEQPKDESEYQIIVNDQQGKSRVTVLDGEGRPENTPTGVRILTLLEERLR